MAHRAQVSTTGQSSSQRLNCSNHFEIVQCMCVLLAHLLQVCMGHTRQWHASTYQSMRVCIIAGRALRPATGEQRVACNEARVFDRAVRREHNEERACHGRPIATCAFGSGESILCSQCCSLVTVGVISLVAATHGIKTAMSQRRE